MVIYKETGQPVKKGDKVPGKRLEKFYAHVEEIGADYVVLLYNGDVKSHKVPLHVIDAINTESVEYELEQKYCLLWDAVNVYAKHIGQEKEGLRRQCYCIFQIDRMSKKIIRQKHVLI